MHSVYNILIAFADFLLPLSKVFSSKMKLFVTGRKDVFTRLAENIKPEDKTIWLHAASLGEYEQGVPVINELKKEFPQHKIIITFFSPSGYEVKKNNKLADLTLYLPLDTPTKARKFVKLAHPDLAIFVKYEVWPNYMSQLKKKNIPAILISGNFRPNQIYFKSYGKFMWKALQSFDHLFVQTTDSAKLLLEERIKNVSVSGDTRFDRVSKQLEMDNHLDFIEEFKNNQLCVVMGSTWSEDEALFTDFINHSHQVKFIIAPHEIKSGNIQNFISKLNKKVVLYSEKEEKNLQDFYIFIIDTVGFLSKIYAYADIAYVGGAAGYSGLHNILEPATFGVPVVIGKNHEKFPEARQLLNLKGLFSVESAEEYSRIMEKLVKDEKFRKKTGKNSGDFIRDNKGATPKIMDFIKTRFISLNDN